MTTPALHGPPRPRETDSGGHAERHCIVGAGPAGLAAARALAGAGIAFEVIDADPRRIKRVRIRDRAKAAAPVRQKRAAAG